MGRVCDLDLGLIRGSDPGQRSGQQGVFDSRFPVEDRNCDVPELGVDIAGADGGRDEDQSLSIGIAALRGGIAHSNYFKAQH